MNERRLTTYAALNMPEGARLLESEEERLAFFQAKVRHADLWVLDLDNTDWVNYMFGNNARLIYATTRPRGWWKKPAKQEALIAIAKALRELALRLEEL